MIGDVGVYDCVFSCTFGVEACKSFRRFFFLSLARVLCDGGFTSRFGGSTAVMLGIRSYLLPIILVCLCVKYCHALSRYVIIESG